MLQADGYQIHEDAPAGSDLEFAEAVAVGLDEHPRSFPYRFLYDARGSRIYERITEQPEYYLTRAEDEILARHGEQIRALAGPSTLVEFGAGSCTKTRRLLDAWLRAGPTRYVPIDISLAALRQACGALVQEYPRLQVSGVCATYERGITRVGDLSPVTFAFLGSSIGNFVNDELDGFLEMISRHLRQGDAFLLGVDLVKEPATLEAAYNDAAGYSARFTLNLLRRMNRELGTAVPLDAAEHVAYYNDRLERIEIYARFSREVHIHLAAVGRRYRIAPGEMIRTEISRKFRAGDVAANAARFGFVCERIWSDGAHRVAVLLLRRVRTAAVAENRVHEIETLLGEVRSRTRALIEPLTDRDLTAQPFPIVGPLAWDLGHIADFERAWLIDAVSRGDGSLRQPWDPQAYPRSERAALELPGRPELLDRLDAVRRQALGILRSGAIDPTNPLTAGGFVYRMVAQHESQHQETMLQALQMRHDLGYDPAFMQPLPIRPDRQPIGETVLVPAGPCQIGTDDRTLAYDNERPRHTVRLPRFAIDAAPVTNGEMLEFLLDGGYRRRRLWSPDGWSWVQDQEIVAPGAWCQRDGRWLRCVFGRWRPLDPARPVVHVSWYEADAFARWAGKRLPTEQEWEKAASWDPVRSQARFYPWGDGPPGPDRANLGQRHPEPLPVGSFPRGRSFYGCHQMLGDVYEWTASELAPYPGFEAFPYPQYSEVFFGRGYKVLRGASWAVPAFMARVTYRNWDLPERRQIFAGFRCVQDL